jgi:tetratricopeptide (TPR) repeat protein
LPSSAGIAAVRRPATRLRAAVLIILLLAIAASLFRFAFQDIKQQQTPWLASERTAVRASFPTGVTIRLPLFVVAGGNESIRGCVALGDPRADADRPTSTEARQSLLARELVSQALLISARDELGLATRNAVLGDWRAGDIKDYDASAELVLQFQPGEVSHASVRRIGQPKGEILVDCKLNDVIASPAESSPDNLGKLVEIAESLSRNEFRELLQRLGASGQANAIRSDVSVPAEVEESLRRLGYAGVFHAVRQTHAAQRKDGESPGRLGALVRGYALLGILTENHWHPAHEVFKARALLYAQRLVARDPRRPWGLWHRAFAEVLAGLHNNALADLAVANTRANELKTTIAPEWTGLITAAARCDLETLSSDRSPLAALAALLRMAQIETEQAPSLAIRTARDVLAIDPECLRATDLMCNARTFKTLDRATLVGPESFAQTLNDRLKPIPELLERAKDQTPARDRSPLEWAEALAAAGDRAADRGEPSWGVLAQLIRETIFVQVYRRLSFLATYRAMSVDDYWSKARAAIAGHPYGQFVECLIAPDRKRPSPPGVFLQPLDLMNLSVSSRELLRSHARGSETETSLIWSAISAHLDHVARDLSLWIAENPQIGDLERSRQVRRLLAISPNSPFARAKLIEADWDASASRSPQWLREARSSPVLFAAVARRSASQGTFSDTVHFLTDYIAISPDAWAYELLARTYRSQGDSARWLATLLDFLKQSDDSGPDQARIRVQIAEYFMEQGQWARAWPYAEQAAAIPDRAAMICAERCAVGLQDWKNAEFWARRTAEWYPAESWDEWFLFCKRTGRGDVESARALARMHVGDASGRSDSFRAQDLGFFHWLCGDLKSALDSFRSACRSYRAVEPGFYAVLVADALGDGTSSESLYQSFVKQHERDAPKTIQIWEILREGTNGPNRNTFDSRPIDQIISALADENRWHMQFLVGEYLACHGREGLARAYLDRSAKSPYATKWLAALASSQVRDIGDRIEHRKDGRIAK